MIRLYLLHCLTIYILRRLQLIAFLHLTLESVKHSSFLMQMVLLLVILRLPYTYAASMRESYLLFLGLNFPIS
jgi:hypothetical protein